jgi:hypothetical protein
MLRLEITIGMLLDLREVDSVIWQAFGRFTPSYHAV